MLIQRLTLKEKLRIINLHEKNYAVERGSSSLLYNGFDHFRHGEKQKKSLMCLNMERMMEMFSKELAEIDKNTVQYMIDEQREQLDKQRKQMNEKDKRIADLEQLLQEKQGT